VQPVQHAAEAGPASPEERPAGVSGRGPETHYITPAGEVDATASVATAQVDKRFATAKARAALAGIELQIIDRGDGQAEYLLTRWNLARSLPDLEAVERWLTAFGAPR
jgi:hypothetical protein